MQHPEAKSLGPDGEPCTAETKACERRVLFVLDGSQEYIGQVLESRDDAESGPKFSDGVDVDRISFIFTPQAPQGSDVGASLRTLFISLSIAMGNIWDWSGASGGTASFRPPVAESGTTCADRRGNNSSAQQVLLTKRLNADRLRIG